MTNNTSESQSLSSKKQMMQGMVNAFAQSDYDDFINYFKKEVVWHMIGHSILTGHKQMKEFIKTMNGDTAFTLILNTLIEEGSTGVVSGTMSARSGSVIDFCDIVEFDEFDKIIKMTSYATEKK